MPRLAKFVTVTFDSFWISGELTMKERKALSFAKSLNKHHKAFIKEYNWNGKWHGHLIPDNRTKLKVVFNVTYRPVVRKKRESIVKQNPDFAI